MIKAEDYLRRYIQKSLPLIEKFFDERKQSARAVSPLAAQMVEIYRRFLGGKRLRGALTYGGYHLFGGEREKDILKVSTIIEIVHAFALMHDDIIDQDVLRRGQPTVHVQYEKIFRQEYPRKTQKNPEHFGLSMAIDVGDLGSYYGNLILCETGFSAETKMEFLKVLSETIVNTVYGQGLDIRFESDPQPTLEKVMKVHLYKTANYTITGPLRYGAVLAGVATEKKIFKTLAQFGTPVGIAFQLRDDELGMFSTEKKLGKPVDSDLKEGKSTLLFVKAFERGTPAQIKFLKYAHGNPQISPSEVDRVRQIIIETGSLEHSQSEGRRLVEKGKKLIPQITADRYYRELLEVLADYVIERDS